VVDRNLFSGGTDLEQHGVGEEGTKEEKKRTPLNPE